MQVKNILGLLSLATILLTSQFVKCDSRPNEQYSDSLESPDIDNPGFEDDQFARMPGMDETNEIYQEKYDEIKAAYMKDPDAKHDLNKVTEIAYKVLLLEDKEAIDKSRKDFMEGGKKPDYMTGVGLSSAYICDKYLMEHCFTDGKTELTNDETLECIKHGNYDEFMMSLPDDFMNEIQKFLPDSGEEDQDDDDFGDM